MSCVISRQQQAADQQCVECGGARGVAGGRLPVSWSPVFAPSRRAFVPPVPLPASLSLSLVLTHIVHQLFFLTHTSATEGFYFLVFHLYRTFRYIRFVGFLIEQTVCFVEATEVFAHIRCECLNQAFKKRLGFLTPVQTLLPPACLPPAPPLPLLTDSTRFGYVNKQVSVDSWSYEHQFYSTSFVTTSLNGLNYKNIWSKLQQAMFLCLLQFCNYFRYYIFKQCSQICLINYYHRNTHHNY